MKTLARPGDKSELLRRLKEVRAETVPRWGRMSAHQMVCHVTDAFRMCVRQKDVRDASGLFHRTLLKWFVLYVPLTWGTGIPTSPELDQEGEGTRPSDFAVDVATLEAVVELIAADPRSLHRQLHPLFGRMSHSAWLRWGYLHMDHHLRQFGA
ncbi:MAG: DUF1569 domain-containing protein [bacterium]